VSDIIKEEEKPSIKPSSAGGAPRPKAAAKNAANIAVICAVVLAKK